MTESSNSWISMKHQIPEPNEPVLCIGKNGGCFIAKAIYDDLDKTQRQAGVYGYIVMQLSNKWDRRQADYWMPLPERPKRDC